MTIGYAKIIRRRRAIWAQFDKRAGGMVDLKSDAGMDSSGGLALLQDAQQSALNPFKAPPC